MQVLDRNDGAEMFLRGQRDYVQGTQVIARAAETLGQGNWVLERSGFTQITQNIVQFCDTKDATQPIGTMRFSTDDGVVRDLFVVETDKRAPSLDIPMQASATRQEGPPEGLAIYDFEDTSVFEDMLNAIVIAIKNEHTVRFENCRNVWLTGLRNLNLPVGGPFPPMGTLRLELQRALNGETSNQTLWRLTIYKSDGSKYSQGAVTFSYQTQD